MYEATTSESAVECFIVEGIKGVEEEAGTSSGSPDDRITVFLVVCDSIMVCDSIVVFADLVVSVCWIVSVGCKVRVSLPVLVGSNVSRSPYGSTLTLPLR